MKQYNTIKAKYPDALLLFRVGDFYETFGEDAVRTAKILDIILTKRGAGSESETELAGFPHHSLNTYLPKLVKAASQSIHNTQSMYGLVSNVFFIWYNLSHFLCRFEFVSSCWSGKMHVALYLSQ